MAFATTAEVSLDEYDVKEIAERVCDTVVDVLDREPQLRDAFEALGKFDRLDLERTILNEITKSLMDVKIDIDVEIEPSISTSVRAS